MPNGESIDAILGLESRGFLFGTLLAVKLKCAFVPIRKAGKLPGDCFKKTYDLEYGSASLNVLGAGVLVEICECKGGEKLDKAGLRWFSILKF
ncbi:unnamed protein product [Mesocestoides corti]|uniref:adenine phosphoribosyltransferase n=1 Tax=Mesocestoides corti TaxID=53468 RepID=A0A0R3UL86_MESCO|nr:unnamed protein product [Mesocestoides corti]